VKYSSTGVYRWHVTFESAAGRTATAVDVNAEGDVAVAGLFFAAAVTSAGVVNWDKDFAPSGNGSSYSVAIDRLGNIVVGGYVSKDMSFGGPTLTSFGGPDGFLVKYSAAGSHFWSKRFGSGASDAVSAVDIDAFNSIGAAGSFSGVAVSFGGQPFDSAGDRDVFAARFAP
jgi:hypothetical protein